MSIPLKLAALISAVVLAWPGSLIASQPMIWAPEVINHISDNWKEIPSVPDTAMGVYAIRFNRSGKATDAMVRKSSGFKDFDDSVLFAIKSAGYFPWPPDGFLDQADYVINLTVIAKHLRHKVPSTIPVLDPRSMPIPRGPVRPHATPAPEPRWLPDP